MTLEYMVGTALAAFFASLAAVAVSIWLSRAEKRRDARAEILRALARHIDRLWAYSAAYGESRIAGIGNGATFNGQFAPFKPSTDVLTAEISATLPYFGRRGQRSVLQLLQRVKSADVENPDRSQLAEWKAESDAMVLIADVVARWSGNAPQLPE